jgi:nicotinamidase-related amidase
MSHANRPDPRRTAVLTVDLQNDFLHPDGAYGRAGQASPHIAALPARVRPVIDALRAAGGLHLSAQFTLVPGPGGEPLISPHLKALRPFLRRGDFEPGAWGHRLTDDFDAPDAVIEKVAYSAFFQTRLDFLLRTLKVEALIVAGIVTNGGVASTLRDAHVRDIPTTLLTDGCAAFDPEVHAASLVSLRTVARQITCAEATAELGAAR